MNKKLLDFLQAQRVSVLGVLQSKNIIHSATLHFAFVSKPLTFYFITEKESKKCKSLLDNKPHSASLVIGFNEEEFTTFQCEGKVEIVSKESELDKGWDAYIAKFSDRANRRKNKDIVLLKFVPTWWRYMNLKTDTQISSED